MISEIFFDSSLLARSQWPTFLAALSSIHGLLLRSCSNGLFSRHPFFPSPVAIPPWIGGLAKVFFFVVFCTWAGRVEAGSMDVELWLLHVLP